MEKELCKIFYFNPVDYDNRGRRKSDGKTFRDIVNMDVVMNCGVINMSMNFLNKNRL